MLGDAACGLAALIDCSLKWTSVFLTHALSYISLQNMQHPIKPQYSLRVSPQRGAEFLPENLILHICVS